MCGIVGLLNLSPEPIREEDVVKRMASYLVHRGPDDDGFLLDGPAALGFRRLQIIDLETGHQPLANEDETAWIIFNGEVYNFVELREELRKLGHVFRTQSDTEVIVHAYESYGLDFVQHLRGMFALALWDKNKQRLVLARDRIGKKPLFYSVRNGQLAFASEIKALLAWPHLNRTINPEALHDYLSFLCVPSPDSIFEGVHKLPPAHILVADRDGSVSVKRYWRVSPQPDRSKSLDFYAEGLREVLAEAVRLRLRSDVPLGAFLSGGIDSTIVAGLMSREVNPVRTFSIGFPDKRFDETSYARLAATSFGTVHTEETVDADSLTPDELTKLVWHMDEPFADSSFIPTYWVSRMARKHVTVALSGDGGDELFAGYPMFRYFQILNRLHALPSLVRNTGKYSAGLSGDLVRGLAPALSERLRRVQKAFEVSSLDPNHQTLALVTYFEEDGKRQLYSSEWRNNMNGYRSNERVLQQEGGDLTGEPLVNFMVREIETGMVDDILVKVDRASMACSLEVRSPLLDQTVVEYAMNIPTEYKLSGGAHKIVLKRACRDLLPEQIVNRGKQGFELPFAQWFQSDPWRSFLMDMLSEERIQTQGIFDARAVIELRDNLLADPEAKSLPISAYQLRHRVWMLFAFQLWYDQFMN
jgi:asparagine synthase (glutamine-hydrolysing)